jgi:hypothetical protein
MTRETTKTGTMGTRKKPGRVPREVMISRIAWAVRNLDDLIGLDRSPLTKVDFVEKYAACYYKDRLCSRGLALRDLITDSMNELISETAENGLHRLNNLLDMLRTGLTISQASEKIGLSREHVSRFYVKQVYRLVTERFLSREERDHVNNAPFEGMIRGVYENPLLR